MVDQFETMTSRVTVFEGLVGRQKLEVDVVNTLAVFEAIDQIQRRAADAANGRQAQFHRTGWNIQRLSAQIEGALVSHV